MQPGLVGVVVGRIHLGILGSVVNNCYFLCNFIFVIPAPLDSIIICEYADIYMDMDVDVCVRKVPSRVALNVMPYILAGIRGDFCANKSLR